LSIPQELNNQQLTFECPQCRHPIVRKGTWFKTIAAFKCPSCKASLRIGYPEKLRLFERHMGLRGKAQVNPRGPPDITGTGISPEPVRKVRLSRR